MWTYEHMSPERRLVLTEEAILSFLHITLCPHLFLFCHSHPECEQRPCLSWLILFPCWQCNAIHSCVTNTDCMNAWRLFSSTRMKFDLSQEVRETELKTSNHYSPVFLLIRLLLVDLAALHAGVETFRLESLFSQSSPGTTLSIPMVLTLHTASTQIIRVNLDFSWSAIPFSVLMES